MEHIEKSRRVLVEFLRLKAKENRITLKMIADRTGISRPNLSRIMTGNSNVTLDNFLKIQWAIGLKLPGE